MKVAITGAAGQIGYALCFRIAAGEMFGPDVDVDLRLLELEVALNAANGVGMELDDCAFPLLRSVTPTADPEVGFGDADWALLIGAVPRKKGMERGDLLNVNADVFTEQGKSIGASASSSCKVVVVGNPCNTNALICRSAGNVPRENVFAMTMLDQNRAVTQLAQKAGVAVGDVKNMIVWGNHSPTMYPDFHNATISGRPLSEVITDAAWLEGEFLSTVQQRGGAIIAARGSSSAASAANAVIDTVRGLTTPTPEGESFSVCVPSDGSYGIAEDIVFSYPVRSDGESYQIVQGIEHGEFGRDKLATTEKELLEEREAVMNLL